MKLLLLGANGQLGQALQQQSAWHSFNTVALNRQQLDITDANALAAALGQHQADVIINCAAYTAVDAAEQQHQQCMAVNVTAVQQLAKWCGQQQALLLHFSTDYVFDGQKATAYTEADAPAPLNFYGRSKWLGEQAIPQHCTKYLLIRTSWLFSGYGHNFYRTMRRLAIAGENVTVVDDQVGCPTSADDMAAVLLQLLKRYQQQGSLPYGLYHLAAQPALSWYQFAQAIFASVGSKGSVQPISSAQRQQVAQVSAAQRPPNSVLDSSLSLQQLGIMLPGWQQALSTLATTRMADGQ